MNNLYIKFPDLQRSVSDPDEFIAVAKSRIDRLTVIYRCTSNIDKRV